MLKTPGSNNLVKKVFSIEGLLFLVALVALGLSIGAMVKDCGEGFGDSLKCEANINHLKDIFPKKSKMMINKSNKFCSTCTDGCSEDRHCGYVTNCTSFNDEKSCNNNIGCYYDNFGMCSNMDAQFCTDVSGGPNPSPSSQCTREKGDLCGGSYGCCRTDNDPGEPVSPICCEGQTGGDPRCQDPVGCKGYTSQSHHRLPPHPPGYKPRHHPKPHHATGFGPNTDSNEHNSKKHNIGGNSGSTLNKKNTESTHLAIASGPSPPSPGSNDGLSEGAIIGISVGSGVALLIVLALVWHLMQGKGKVTKM